MAAIATTAMATMPITNARLRKKEGPAPRCGTGPAFVI
jgi:hypothetical protein